MSERIPESLAWGKAAVAQLQQEAAEIARCKALIDALIGATGSAA